MNDFFPTLIFWLPLLLIALFILFKKKSQANELNQLLPPSPPRLPIIGNLHQLGALPHRSILRLSKKYGPVMLLKLGRVPVVYISSADAARQVLKVNDIASCSRAKMDGMGKLTYNQSNVAFAPYCESWRQLRKVYVLELFSVKRVKSFRFVREEEISSLMNSISESASSATPIDISQSLYSLTGSIIYRVAFGKSFQEGDDFDRGRKFYELILDTETVVASLSLEELFPGVGWVLDKLSGRNRRLQRVFQALDKFFEAVIDEHLKPGRKSSTTDIVDVLLGIEKEQIENGEPWLTRNHIKAVLLDLFLAGVDTMALIVGWAMAELSKKPEVMKKAQTEVRNIIGNRGRVTEEDLEQLEYLKLIIKETMRLHPPGPMLIPREAISHFKINGYNIYPKTVIHINVWAIARDPTYWENTEDFCPERFIDSAIDYKGQDFEFLPFGSGRRGCPGMYMGMVSAEILLANLLYCFDWKLPDGMKEEDLDMEEKAGHCLTLSKKTPLLLVPSKYLPS